MKVGDIYQYKNNPTCWVMVVGLPRDDRVSVVILVSSDPAERLQTYNWHRRVLTEWQLRA